MCAPSLHSWQAAGDRGPGLAARLGQLPAPSGQAGCGGAEPEAVVVNASSRVDQTVKGKVEVNQLACRFAAELGEGRG